MFRKQMTVLQVVLAVAVIAIMATFALAKTVGVTYTDALVLPYNGTTLASISTAGLITGVGVVSTSYTRLASKTLAELKLITPGAVGELYYCSDATAAVKVIVSTGTTIGAFALITSSTTVPS
jgi:hypothetical protein